MVNVADLRDHVELTHTNDTLDSVVKEMDKYTSFDGHKWQNNDLDRAPREQATQECSQIGASGAHLRKALAVIGHLGLNATYTMPVSEMVKSYVPTRSGKCRNDEKQ